ncbi:hypothetical protein GFC30_1115 [Anoxybacillus amylolyticus]|uniref:Uncharacterized protein n=1 Tax=Anoxybacteroides amylolyticum TaxID=294699 RepID=A0A167TRQ3_9BACL|nr:hypothetical protein [Anoxybacillus amylolyticus]ANB62050.1 hypothetical protein GFC30_1115 [Anoxybacillus amylolyticus]
MTGHAVSTIAGMIETGGSEALEVGGASLTATGEGVFVGVPAMAMTGEGMAYGQAETALSFHRLVKNAEELYQRMSRGEGASLRVIVYLLMGRNQCLWIPTEKHMDSQ